MSCILNKLIKIGRDQNMFDIIMVVFQTPILEKKNMYIKKLHVILKNFKKNEWNMNKIDISYLS